MITETQLWKATNHIITFLKTPKQLEKGAKELTSQKVAKTLIKLKPKEIMKKLYGTEKHLPKNIEKMFVVFVVGLIRYHIGVLLTDKENG